MNCAITILAEVYLIDVGVQQVGLVEPQFEDDRHGEFLEFAAKRAAIVEEEALDQLLGKGAAPLLHFPGAQIRPERPGNAH